MVKHGCRCSQCYGFAEYLTELGLDTRGIKPAPGHTVTRTIIKCQRTYQCACPDCTRATAKLTAHRAANPITA